jgi:hypothetical protein
MTEDFNAQDYPDTELDWADTDSYEYEDTMDGDWDSAMASAGYGTDEDYGFIEDVF